MNTFHRIGFIEKNLRFIVHVPKNIEQRNLSQVFIEIPHSQYPPYVYIDF